MLNRRHLRIKVLQMLYAFYNDKENSEIAPSEKELFHSIERIYDLYIYLLLSFEELKLQALKKHDERKKKLRPSSEDLSPNLKFVSNMLLLLIEDSKALTITSQRRKINWKSAEKQEIFRKMFLEIEKSEVYFEYMHNDVNEFEEDRAFLIQLFKKEIANSTYLYDFFEDEDILWMDDIDLVCNMVIKTIKMARTDEAFDVMPLYKIDDDEKEFIGSLLRSTIERDKESEELINQLAENWEFDRIAKMDVLLLKMALTELQVFENIPTKVTINEYIDISKYYSTPKSNVFINGILDKAVNLLSQNDKIKKSGRGLIQ